MVDNASRPQEKTPLKSEFCVVAIDCVCSMLHKVRLDQSTVTCNKLKVQRLNTHMHYLDCFLENGVNKKECAKVCSLTTDQVFSRVI